MINEVPRTDPVIVEIPDNDMDGHRVHTIEEDAPSQEEVEALAKSLGEMFPDTDKEYIRVRAQDLVGHAAAIERLVL